MIETNQQHSKHKKFSKLQNTLILWFVLLSLLPLLLISALSYQQASNSLKAAAKAQLQLSSQLTVAHIQDWFNYRFMDLKSQAESLKTAEMLATLSQGLQQSGKSVDEFTSSNEWILTVNSLQNDLISLSRRYDYINDIYIIDNKGNVLYSLIQNSELGSNMFNTKEPTLFSMSVSISYQTRKMRFSGFERYTPAGNALTGFLTAPIFDYFGNKMGVFAIQLKLEKILSYLNLTKPSGSSLTHYLIGKDGLLRTPTNQDWGEVLNRIIDTEQFWLWQREYDNNMADQPIVHHQAMEYLGPNGKSVIGLHRPVKINNLQWALISEIDTDEALTPIRWLGKTIMGLAILTGLLVTAIAIWVAGRITRPLVSLANISIKVAAGKPIDQVDHCTPIEPNEIGQLTDAFNHMLLAKKQNEQALIDSNNKAQQALTRVQQQQFALDQHANVSITDIKGRITYINQKFCDIIGYKASELIGKNHRIISSGVHDRRFFKELYKTISRDQVWRGEVCNKTKHHQLVWMDTTIVPFKDPEGKTVSYIAIRTDITERKNADIILKESEQQHRLLFEKAADAYFILDQGQFADCNDAALSMFKARREQLIGLPAESLFPQIQPDGTLSKNLIQKKINLAIDKKHTQFESKQQRFNGTEFWSDVTLSVMQLHEHDVLFVSLRDISQRKQAEWELAENSKHLELVINTTAVGIWDWHLQSGEIQCNDRWFEIAGYNANELTPFSMRSWKAQIHPDDINRLMQEINLHVNRHTDSFICEIRMKHKSGQWVWVLCSGKWVELDENTVPQRVIGTLLDISDRKQIETALIEAKNEAELAAQAKSAFLASMSHEIRTPMNGVLGMLGLLKGSHLNEDQRQKLDIARSSAESLLTLINDILDYSKVEAGKMELEQLNFNLHAMISDFAKAMAHQAQTQQLELILDLVGVEHSMVTGDPTRIRQILTNLTSNALKFTHQGEVIIRARLESLNQNQWQLYCSVTDTGIGIPEDKLPALFDSFSQVDASTTRKYGGTGLGLAIVKQLCQLMKGDISVSSTTDFGTNFEFHIPLGKCLDSEPIFPDQAVSALNMLIVDDNTTNCDVISAQLEHWDINVTQAHSGSQAIALCEQRATHHQSPFDIAIIDMQMPEMSGAQLGKVLTQDPRFNSIKLVMMSSMSEHTDASDFAEFGFSASFLKPCTTSDLCAVLNIATESGQSTKLASLTETTPQIQALAPEEMSVIPQSKITQWTAKAKILLVEDNQINQMVAQGILSELGLSADIATNGLNAIKQLRQTHTEAPYNLILMDCQMPEMDGYEATRQIRFGAAGELYKSITIIAMTANAMSDDKQKCINAGMDDYLSKPIETQLLLNKLQYWLLPINCKLSTHTASHSPSIATKPTENKKRNNDNCIWNKQALLNRTLGNLALYQNLITLFLEDTPEKLDQLQKAVKHLDHKEIIHLSHSIKGVAGNLGGVALQQHSALLEAAAKVQESNRYSTLLSQLNKSFNTLQHHLEDEMACCSSATETEVNNTEQVSATQRPNSSDTSAFIDKLEIIIDKLNAGEYIAPEELHLTLPDNCNAKLSPLLAQFQKQVNNFDIDSAVATHSTLLTHLKS